MTWNIVNVSAIHLTEVLFFAPNLMSASNTRIMHFLLRNSKKSLSLFEKPVDLSKPFALRPFQLQILTRPAIPRWIRRRMMSNP
jgi:hypothetical protein